jgi:hypothetical protein
MLLLEALPEPRRRPMLLQSYLQFLEEVRGGTCQASSMMGSLETVNSSAK